VKEEEAAADETTYLARRDPAKLCVLDNDELTNIPYRIWLLHSNFFVSDTYCIYFLTSLMPRSRVKMQTICKKMCFSMRPIRARIGYIMKHYLGPY